jgi:hypothetical protein
MQNAELELSSIVNRKGLGRKGIRHQEANN